MTRYKIVFRALLAIAMIVVGVKHFTDPAPFVSIVPFFLPHPLALVYSSGFFEILGGAGLLIPQFSCTAAWILVILFVAVFPANLYQAIYDIPVPALPHDPPLIWLRLPFQALLVVWAGWFTRQDNHQF